MLCVCLFAWTFLVQLIAPGLVAAAKDRRIDFSKWWVSFLNFCSVICPCASPAELLPYLYLLTIYRYCISVGWNNCRSQIIHSPARRHVFFADERFVPLKHDDNNFRFVKQMYDICIWIQITVSLPVQHNPVANHVNNNHVDHVSKHCSRRWVGLPELPLVILRIVASCLLH